MKIKDFDIDIEAYILIVVLYGVNDFKGLE